MERRFAFLGLGRSNHRLLECAEHSFPDVDRVGFSDIGPAGDSHASGGLLTQEAATPARAVEGASHVFLDARYGRALTYLTDAAPALSESAIVFDMLPVKMAIRNHLKEVVDSDLPYLGGHWINVTEQSPPSLLVVGDETREWSALQEERPVLGGILGLFAESRVFVAPNRHDLLIAQRLQLPFLAYRRREEPDIPELDEVNLPITVQPPADSSHPALSFEALIANQSILLDQLSALTTHLQKVRNRLFSEDREYFEQEG